MQRLRDRIRLVRDDMDTLERDAERAETVGEPRGVGVGDETTEDLIPDDEHGRCEHRPASPPPRRPRTRSAYLLAALLPVPSGQRTEQR